jgi:hypothetical protein
MCGDKTLDSLSQGYKNMLFTKDRITEIQRIIMETETTDKLRPEVDNIEAQFHHDNDKTTHDSITQLRFIDTYIDFILDFYINIFDHTFTINFVKAHVLNKEIFIIQSGDVRVP